jgi:hypothetical protein
MGKAFISTSSPTGPSLPAKVNGAYGIEFNEYVTWPGGVLSCDGWPRQIDAGVAVALAGGGAVRMMVIAAVSAQVPSSPVTI